MEGLEIHYNSYRRKYFCAKYLLIGIVCICSAIFLQGCMKQDFLLNMESSLFNTAENKKSIYKLSDMGPKPGGQINIFSTIPDTFNPILTQNQYVKDFLELICEPLVLLDNEQKPVPWLCSSWSYSDDGHVFAVQLRKEVKWHDGTRLTSFDVINTLDLIFSNKASIYRPLLNNIAAYEAKDFENIIFHLKKPYAFTPYSLIFPIAPKNTAKNSYSISGTGPYSVKSYVPDKYIVLEKNDNWWYNQVHDNLTSNNENKTNPKITYPLIDSIKIKFYEKSTDPIKAFLADEVDIAFINSSKSENINKYSIRPDINILAYPATKLEFISINTKSKNLNDNKIKKFIKNEMWSVQFSQLISKPVMRVKLPFWPKSFMNHLIDIDSNKSNQNDNDINDIDARYFQGIKQIKIIANKENSHRIKLAEYLAEKLKQHGANVNIEILAWDEFLKTLYLLQYDIAFVGCDLTSTPDISYLYTKPYVDSNTPLKLAGFNFAGFEDDTADIVMNRFLSMKFEDIIESSILNEFFNIVDNQTPYVALFVFQEAIMTDRKIRAVSQPLPWRRLNEVYKWYISGE